MACIASEYIEGDNISLPTQLLAYIRYVCGRFFESFGADGVVL